MVGRKLLHILIATFAVVHVAMILKGQNASLNQIAAGVLPQKIPAAAATPAVQPAPAQIDSLLKFDAESKSVTVSNGTPEAQFTFHLTNASPGEITVFTVSTSCGCTVAKLPQEPWRMAPGTNGEIRVTMNLAGKMGMITKAVNVMTDKGYKQLHVITTILPPATLSATMATDRDLNQRIATTDRQAVFKGDCARCHAAPARGQMGTALYVSACGVCHDSENRASTVPNLHTIPQETNAEFWRTWITQGKPGTMMPAFAQSAGGILNDSQVVSLVNYLLVAMPSRPTPHARLPASKSN